MLPVIRLVQLHVLNYLLLFELVVQSRICLLPLLLSYILWLYYCLSHLCIEFLSSLVLVK